jgi:hypothetical protein
MHESFVHTLLSSQLTVVPAQAPPEQTSLPVQKFPSLHTTALLVCVQPLTGSQASVVQTLPSSQELLLYVCVQPLAGSQESSVQTFSSSQLGAAPHIC